MNDEPQDPADKSDQALTEDLLEYSWKALGRATDHFGRIDSKATTLAGFIALIVTALTKIASDAFTFPAPFGAISALRWGAFMLLVASLLWTFGCCVYALSLRRLTQIPRSRKMVGFSMTLSATSASHRRLLKLFVNQIATAEDDLYSALLYKEKAVGRSLYGLWVALILVVVVAVLSLFSK
jgi:hypothetical protein